MLPRAPAFRPLFRRTVLGTGAAIAALGLSGCLLQGPLYRYRYKLTLQVLADGVVHTGVNVVQVDWRLPAGPPDAHLPSAVVGAVVKGEANVVDLGGGRLLVALLTKRIPDPGETWEPGAPRPGWGEVSPDAVMGRAYGLGTRRPDAAYIRAGMSQFLETLIKQRGPREIGPDNLPTLVTFRDSADPTTVEQVDPRNLAKTLGYGVTLQSATLEITTEPLTVGIERRLPWLVGMSTQLSGVRWSSQNTLDSRLNPNDFILPFRAT